MPWLLLLAATADVALARQVPFTAARHSALAKGEAPSGGESRLLRRVAMQPAPPSIPALLLATLVDNVLHRGACRSCSVGSVLMMSPEPSLALDEAEEAGQGVVDLVVGVVRSYVRGLAAVVKMLLRRPDVPQRGHEPPTVPAFHANLRSGSPKPRHQAKKM